jgi:hypothetical protein
MNRQKVLLLVLLALLAVAVMYAYFRMPEQKTAAKSKSTPGGPAETRKAETAKGGDLKRVRLDLLDRLVPRFTGFKRNIFWLRPYATAKKLPPPPPPPPPSPPPKAPQPVAAVKEIAKFTFLGFLKNDAGKFVFLSKDKEIFVVKKGDKIANTFLVTNVSDDFMTINTVSGGDEIVIPLVENMPLKPRPK